MLIDLTPEALLERLRAGKVYPPERIDAALNNFFRIENLAALREVALRQVAEEVGAKRLTTELVGSREESLAADAPQAVGERLLALVEPYPGAQRLVRRAWRSAQRLGAGLDLLWVRAPGQRLSEEQERSLAALRQLASVLGARMIEQESDDFVGGGRRASPPSAGRTYILIGRSRPARGLARLRVPLPQRLMAQLPGVDVRIVADRSKRPNDRHDGERQTASEHERARGRDRRRSSPSWWASPPATGCRRTDAGRPRPAPARGAASCSRSPARRSRALVRGGRAPGKAENAIVMPAFLARVPMNLPLETALPVQSRARDAAARGDRAARCPRRASPSTHASAAGARPATRCAGCSSRSTSTASSCPPMKTRAAGLSYDDLRWLLERVPAEILILRPAPEDTRRISAAAVERPLLSHADRIVTCGVSRQVWSASLSREPGRMFVPSIPDEPRPSPARRRSTTVLARAWSQLP